MTDSDLGDSSRTVLPVAAVPGEVDSLVDATGEDGQLITTEDLGDFFADVCTGNRT